MTDRPLVSVIVPHYQDLENLGRCLDALGVQTYPADRIEVLVADNNSAIGVDAILAVIAGRARLVVVEERGAGPARNGGVIASKGEVLAFTDSDCLPSPQWLSEGVAALDRFDFVGGRVVVSVDDEANLTPTEAFEKVFAFDFKNYIERKGFTGSGNMFVSRTVFDAVGGFRSGVAEDVDWSCRATALAYRLGYAPKAIVSHAARRDWSELRSKWRRMNRERFALEATGIGGRARWLGRTLLLPVSALAHTPKVIRSDHLKTGRDRLGALTILYRSRLWRFGDALKLVLAR